METIKLTKNEYETLMFIANKRTIFTKEELNEHPLNGFMGKNQVLAPIVQFIQI